MADEEIERVYTISFSKLRNIPRTHRAPRAIKHIREFAARHMKVEPEEVWIDHRVNEMVWARGRKKMPSRIRVKMIKFEEVVEVVPPEE
jgi:large subunit ribosomal protein L31e